jgi:hypothetical protein
VAESLPGVTIEARTDLLWTLGSAELYRLLVVERGWRTARDLHRVADCGDAHS